MDALQDTYKDDDDDEEEEFNPQKQTPQNMQFQVQTNPSIQPDPFQSNPEIEPDPVQFNSCNEIINTQFNETVVDQVSNGGFLSNPNLDSKIEPDPFQSNPSIEPDPVKFNTCNEIINTQFNKTGTNQVSNGGFLSNPNLESKIEPDPFLSNPSMEPDPVQFNPCSEIINTDETVVNQVSNGDFVSNPNLDSKIERDPIQLNPSIESDPVEINSCSEIMTTQISETVTTQISNDDFLSNPNLESKIESDPVQLNSSIESDPVQINPSDEIITTQISETMTTQINNDVLLSNPDLDPKSEPESKPVVESSENPTQDASSDSISEEQEQEQDPPSKKQKSVSNFDLGTKTTPISNGGGTSSGKKSSKKKSKGNNVWTKTTSRKGKKKAKNFNGSSNGNGNGNAPKLEDTVLITPMPRFLDKNDDSLEAKICLSKVYKAEKVELSEDRLSAGSCKGYRMVRATRGVSEGAWFFEIKVVSMGETGHTRLGWSTEKGDLQAPVGYDGNSFGYRDIDGSKIHKALREKYGDEGYKEGDVIGFYINLPEGNSYALKSPQLVWYKGQKYVCAPDPKEDPPKIIPGSEISFFKNGVCQGVAFKDLFGGRYYPAASMYTLPNQPNCVVKFNFGPNFDCFPTEFEGRPIPKPMIEVPYHGFDNRVENGVLEESKQ